MHTFNTMPMCAGATYATMPTVIVISLGKMAEAQIAPNSFWRTHFYLPEARFVKMNVSVPSSALVGVYGGKNVRPSHTLYDFFQVFSGEKLMLNHGKHRFARSLRAIVSVFLEELGNFTMKCTVTVDRCVWRIDRVNLQPTAGLLNCLILCTFFRLVFIVIFRSCNFYNRLLQAFCC